jgi:hypothetical protein
MCDTIAAGSNVVFNGGYSWSSSSVGAVNGDGQWIVNGSLALGATDTIKGVQAFTLNSGATLETANPNGFASNGNIQVTGTQTYSTGANYEYNGSVPQVTGALLPATVNNLTIDNVSGVALSQATTMDGVLSLSAGVLDNSVNPIVLGPSGSVVSTGGGLNIPLPVEMTSFMASADGPNAKLCWRTATETNNYGFEIERRAISNSQWSKIGFVAGAGTSTSQREYSYFDKGLATGKYVYRIKQVDNDGTFKYSFSAEVEVVGMPKLLKLDDNYPNPFNPTTTIQFTVPQNGLVRLRIYNVIGQEVANLFNGPAEVGNLYKVKFEVSSLPSGLYFSVLEFGNQRLTRKMVLAK